MLKTSKRKIISSITALATVFSFGAANTLDAYNTVDVGAVSVKLDYDHIEELADGGKIYVYTIDGQTHKFPVPPEGFNPLTATDEQLETYGFPPRPDEQNAEDYADWVEIMSCCKSTPVPEIKQIVEYDEHEENMISELNNIVEDISQVGAGYSAAPSSGFCSQVQGDFVQPAIIDTQGTCVNTFMIGLGDISYNPNGNYTVTAAGTRCVGQGQAYAYYECQGGGNVAKKSKVLSNVEVNSGDKVHVYVAYQKANNAFNYYVLNVTTGQYSADVFEFDHSYFYSGRAVWYAGREKKIQVDGITWENLHMFRLPSVKL